MDVNVVPAEKVRIDAVALGVRACPGQCGSHGFLHHFAEVPGHGELLATAHPSGFDEDDVASHRRPDESDGHAGPLDALLHFLLRAELRHAEQFRTTSGVTVILSVLPSAMRRACLRVMVAI